MFISEDTKLARVLTTVDLTALGIGSTLGVGIYVLAGEVAKNYAGPAVVISFLIAAIASIFAGLCYAEFGARVPKAGSAYVYSYVSVGELIAFLIGWNLILEYVIGSASVVKGLFTYLDALVNNAMSKFLQQHIPLNLSSIAPFPDFFSLGVTLVFSVALALGAKESSAVNNVFTCVNLAVVLFVIISGFWQVNTANWFIPKEQVPSEKYGNGGFAPYGISGIIRGAAACFYGFIGFDCIATAGAMFPLPRIIYAMASDGLLFQFMGKIHPKFQTPFLGTLLAGLFTGTLSCIFELSQLFKMMAMGTLLAYSVVAACVLILRYRVIVDNKKEDDQKHLTMKLIWNQLFNRDLNRPTRLSSLIVTGEVCIFCKSYTNCVYVLQLHWVL
ncbi:inner membrane transporter ygji-related [Holotrichia oblita]|uniref:Inner membrane transporter ygji-related n=1 Tax=Holotrichia oblita TaxID=644536 RepID=A0ACB9T489_HOLOL|nr:inner membrane transporter ygji-related [Holotrichia oblita]